MEFCGRFDLNTHEKYQTLAVQFYKRKIEAEAKGLEFTEEMPLYDDGRKLVMGGSLDDDTIISP